MEWLAEADYSDGTHVERRVPYLERGNIREENERQYALECWLLEQAENHGGIEWYSVCCVEQ